MTGHLVLSTLHANDAATAFPRLFDFNVEPFLIASTVNIIIAQRLVRRICMQCRVSLEAEAEKIGGVLPPLLFQKYFGGKKTVRVYKGKGCPVCHGTGYEGRLGIFEIITMEETIRKAILEKKDSPEIQKIAIENGMTTMMDDGVRKVLEGLTTIEEILRVTKE
jgi:type II secretory ATPase GspE/PulE/Tfp pilus assembly ATPase PilB-like protein